MIGGPGIIRNASGERIDYTFTPAAGQRGAAAPSKVVILAHGVTAHKERPLLVTLADALARAGLASLRLSFAGNGDSEGRFVDAVPSKEVGDVRDVLDALAAWGVERIAYAGHSMGGAVGVLAASRDSVTSQAAMIGVPWLLVHGDADELVPYQDSLDAVAAAGGRPTLVTLRGVDHRFNGALPQVVDAVVPWIRERL